MGNNNQSLELATSIATPLLAAASIGIVLGSVYEYNDRFLSPWAGVPEDIEYVAVKTDLSLNLLRLPPEVLAQEPSGRPRRKRIPKSRRVKEISSLVVVQEEYASGSFNVKLYANKPGWVRKLYAKKTGMTWEEAGKKFDEVVIAVKELAVRRS